MTAAHRITLFFVMALCAPIALTGCSTNRPIAEEYAPQLQKLAPGTSLADFKTILPGAYVAGQNQVHGVRIEAYELNHEYIFKNYRTGFRDVERQKLWFYFHDQSLVKWGKPNDWPESPDLIIERRDR